MTTTSEQPGSRSHGDDFVSTEEPVRRSGAKPFTTFDDLASEHDPFESDGEYAEFLTDLYASRGAGIS